MTCQKNIKSGIYSRLFFVAHVLDFFHFQTRFPHSLFKNFLRKIFKRAQTMLQSWLKFTDSFSFQFLKFSRFIFMFHRNQMCVIKNFRKIKAFLRNAISKRKMISYTLRSFGTIFKLKNINNIQNFGNNLHSLQKNKSFAPLELTKTSTIFFLQTFCSYRTILPEVKLLKIFKQTLSTL